MRLARRRSVLAAPAVAMLGILTAFWLCRASIREARLSRDSTESLRTLAESNPTDSLANYLYARRLVDKGDPQSALEPVRRAAALLSPTALDPSSERVRVLAGYVSAQFSIPDEALQLLRHGNATPARDPEIHLGIGIVAMRTENYAEAVSEFRLASRVAPSRAECWSRLGAAILATGDPGAAIEPLQRAASLAAKDSEAQAHLGEALSQLHRFSEAAESYRRAVMLAPSRAEYHPAFALAAAAAARSEEEYRDAVTRIDAILLDSPQDEHMRLSLAGIHMRFGRMLQARRELEKILEPNPRQVDAWFNLCTVCDRLADPEAAAIALSKFQSVIDSKLETVALRRRLVKERNNAKLHLRLAVLLRRDGNPEAGFKELQRAATLAPKDAEINRIMRAAQDYYRGSRSPVRFFGSSQRP